MPPDDRYTFTDHLFAVAVGSAFNRLDAGQQLQHTIRLTFAFLVVFDDYLRHDLAVLEMKEAGNNVVLWF